MDQVVGGCSHKLCTSFSKQGSGTVLGCVKILVFLNKTNVPVEERTVATLVHIH